MSTSKDGKLKTKDGPAFDFLRWMNSKKLKSEAVCVRFGASLQTIRHWRSKGVPKSRQEFVLNTIAGWDTGSTGGPTLYIYASKQQFRAWSEAARDEKKILEDWAMEGLDEMAKEYFSKKGPRPLTQNEEETLRAAEEQAEYHARKTPSGNLA